MKEKIWLYAAGDNPFKYFVRNDFMPTEICCFFSSREKVLKHFFLCNGNDFMPTNCSEDTWSPEFIQAASLSDLESWYKEFVDNEGDPEYIFEVPLDVPLTRD